MISAVLTSSSSDKGHNADISAPAAAVSRHGLVHLVVRSGCCHRCCQVCFSLRTVGHLASLLDPPIDTACLPALLLVVLPCTAVPAGSEELLIHAEDIVNMPRRSDVVGGVRRFVDISVPRNVAPGINAEQHAAIVYNVDDLKEVVVANKEARAAAAAEAEVLLR